MKRLLTTLCVCVPLGACQTDSNAGSGPLTLTPSSQALFIQYKKLHNPGAFAVSIDGRFASYRYCPDNEACRFENSVQKAIQYCQEHSGGVPCKIYAIDCTVVWKGAGG